jgi:hypothetical protein
LGFGATRIRIRIPSSCACVICNARGPRRRFHVFIPTFIVANIMTMGCSIPNRTRTDTHSRGIFGERSHSHSHGHDTHVFCRGLIEALQKWRCALVPFTYLCITMLTHVNFFHIALPSLAIYCLISYREGSQGRRVKLVGLGANILLTSAKGWYMNSAALFADAGHSLP